MHPDINKVGENIVFTRHIPLDCIDIFSLYLSTILSLQVNKKIFKIIPLV
jgi:hypothetical protein